MKENLQQIKRVRAAISSLRIYSIFQRKLSFPPWVSVFVNLSHLLTTLASSVNFYIYYFKYGGNICGFHRASRRHLRTGNPRITTFHATENGLTTNGGGFAASGFNSTVELSAHRFVSDENLNANGVKQGRSSFKDLLYGRGRGIPVRARILSPGPKLSPDDLDVTEHRLEITRLD